MEEFIDVMYIMFILYVDSQANCQLFSIFNFLPIDLTPNKFPRYGIAYFVIF